MMNMKQVRRGYSLPPGSLRWWNFAWYVAVMEHLGIHVMLVLIKVCMAAAL